MAVHVAHRRRGIGRALLLEILRIAAAEGFPPVFLHAQTSALPFYAGVGFVPEGGVFEEAGIAHQRMRLGRIEILRLADLGSRRLGDSPGLLRLDSSSAQQHAIGRLAAQARLQLLIRTPDLEPALYDRAPVLNAVLRLAMQRSGRLPVRVLVADPTPSLKRGHRLIDLARRFSSAIQIRTLPEQCADAGEACLLADEMGYGLRPTAEHDSLLVNFADGGQARRLRRRFELLWQHSQIDPELRQLYL
jgi:hypothetical protein